MHTLCNILTHYGSIEGCKVQELKRIMKRILKKLDPFLQYVVQLITSAQIKFCLKVQDFWDFYVHLVRPNDLPNTSDYHLFKDGIKPMWEVCPSLPFSLQILTTPISTSLMDVTLVLGCIPLRLGEKNFTP